MQRLITTPLMITLLGLAILWVGCSTPTTDVASVDPAKPNIQDLLLRPDPEWFPIPVEDPSYIYGYASRSSKYLQLALDDARNAARFEIAIQIETKIRGLFERFRQEVGAEEDAELLATTIAVSKEVVSEVPKEAKTTKQDLKREGSFHIAYVLMEMPIGEANAALMQKIKTNRNMYTRLRASQGFKELEAEVEKYKKWKEKQGK